MQKRNNRGSTAQLAEKIVRPIVEQMGLYLWDVQFVKEGAVWYLRVFIDKDSGITIEDCENVTRAIDEPLDKADPIEQSYCLEVSSPGVERELVRDEHFDAFLGAPVMVKLIRPLQTGVREFKGTLLTHDKSTVSVIAETGEQMTLNKKEIVYIKLDDFEL